MSGKQIIGNFEVKTEKLPDSSFLEQEAYVVWYFLLDHVKSGGTAEECHLHSFWREFKDKNEKSLWKRTPDEYKNRYFKNLAPNLHKMSFDAKTKALLYQSLIIPVNPDFRQQLINETGVKINDMGVVIEFKNRPELSTSRSCHFPVKPAALKPPIQNSSSTAPKRAEVSYTDEEEDEIWTFIRQESWGKKGRIIKLRYSLQGDKIWTEFKNRFKSKRSTKSLARHFCENMLPSIMSTRFDFVTKMELFFALNNPVSPDDLSIIMENTYEVVLNRKGAINYVNGDVFTIGKKFAHWREKRSGEERNEGVGTTNYRINYVKTEIVDDPSDVPANNASSKPPNELPRSVPFLGIKHSRRDAPLVAEPPRHVPYYPRHLRGLEMKSERSRKQQQPDVTFEEFKKRIKSKQEAVEATPPPPKISVTQNFFTISKTRTTDFRSRLPIVSQHYYNEDEKKRARSMTNRKVVNELFNGIEGEMKQFIRGLTEIRPLLGEESRQHAFERCEQLARKFRVGGMNGLIMEPAVDEEKTKSK